MNLLWLLVVVLLILAIAGLPRWGYWPTTGGYGYGPSGIIGVILVVLVILLLLGRI
jgi:hypothetical protein